MQDAPVPKIKIQNTLHIPEGEVRIISKNDILILEFLQPDSGYWIL